MVGIDPDGDELEIIFDRQNLPENVRFTDNRDGTASFEWQTNNNDEGVYYPLFTLFDGELRDEATVEITVLGVNREPEWGDFPVTYQVEEGENLLFEIFGTDPDDDELAIEFIPEDLPLDAAFVITENGRGVLSWTPGYGDQRIYIPRFILSDAEVDLDLEIEIEVIDVDVPDIEEYLTPDENRFELFGAREIGRPMFFYDR